MQGSYIGNTTASQAVKAGSTPVPCSRKEPTFVYDKCGFFSTKSVLTDGINPSLADEITS